MLFLNKRNADIEHYVVFNLDCSVLNERNTKIDDATGVIRIRKSKITDNTMTKWNRTRGQTKIHKTLHRKRVRRTWG